MLELFIYILFFIEAFLLFTILIVNIITLKSRIEITHKIKHVKYTLGTLSKKKKYRLPKICTTLLYFGSHTVASYNTKQDKIFLNLFEVYDYNDITFLETILHEYQHAIDYRKNPELFRQLYNELKENYSYDKYNKFVYEQRARLFAKRMVFKICNVTILD